MRTTTVLGHLARDFGPQQENLATKALCFILQTFPAMSRAFKEFLRPLGFDFPGGLYFEAQRGGLGQSIPDIKCRDNRGLLRVIVENKFWAGLTENQPVTYIRELPVGSAVLLFVVPEARRRLVWDELVRRCIGAAIPVGETQRHSTLAFAEVGARHYMAVTSWGVLLNSLSTEATLAGEIDCQNDIAQLQGLCNTMDDEEVLPLRTEELTNQNMPRRFINFSDLAVAIVQRAQGQGLCNIIKFVPEKDGYGASIRIGEYAAWLGFDVPAWRSKGVSPIWLTFLSDARMAEIREKLVRLRASTPKRCFEFKNGRVMVPIVLLPEVEKDRIIEDAVDQVEKLLDELGITKALRVAPNPTLTDGLDAEGESRLDS